jgi:hypothetical protein
MESEAYGELSVGADECSRSLAYLIVTDLLNPLFLG